MSEHTDQGHQNPTSASPEADPGQPDYSHTEDEHDSRSRDMLLQLQQMIDSLAARSGPVMRDVAAKAAELAALAAERTGPIAHRAADVTERVSERVAARSKEMAAELRRQQAEERAGEGAQAAEEQRADG